MTTVLRKIVSGGQTGVDRGALDAALESSFPCGGWYPEGRLAEDGPIPEQYPVIVLPGAGYPERTRQNVVDSDGTLVIYWKALSGGTLRTANLCQGLGKPFLARDAAEKNAFSMAVDAWFFCERHRIGVLNVAGPRSSGEPEAHLFAKAVVSHLIEIERTHAKLPKHLEHPLSPEEREQLRLAREEACRRSQAATAEDLEDEQRYWRENRGLFNDD